MSKKKINKRFLNEEKRKAELRANWEKHFCLLFQHMGDNCPNDVKTHNFECSYYLYSRCKMHDKNDGGC